MRFIIIFAFLMFGVCCNNSIYFPNKELIIGKWKSKDNDKIIVFLKKEMIIENDTISYKFINNETLKLSDTWIDDKTYPWFLRIEKIDNRNLILYDSLWQDTIILITTKIGTIQN